MENILPSAFPSKINTSNFDCSLFWTTNVGSPVGYPYYIIIWLSLSIRHPYQSSIFIDPPSLPILFTGQNQHYGIAAGTPEINCLFWTTKKYHTNMASIWP